VHAFVICPENNPESSNTNIETVIFFILIQSVNYDNLLILLKREFWNLSLQRYQVSMKLQKTMTPRHQGTQSGYLYFIFLGVSLCLRALVARKIHRRWELAYKIYFAFQFLH